MKTRAQTQKRTKTVGWAAALVFLAVSAIDAHHTRATFFDVDTAVTITGTIVRFEPANPHSHLYVELATPEGRVEWKIEGPPPRILNVRGTDQAALIAGETVDVCGYMLKEKGDGEGLPDVAAHFMSAELVVMPDGVPRLWGDYGNTHCREQYGAEHLTR